MMSAADDGVVQKALHLEKSSPKSLRGTIAQWLKVSSGCSLRILWVLVLSGMIVCQETELVWKEGMREKQHSPRPRCTSHPPVSF